MPLSMSQRLTTTNQEEAGSLSDSWSGMLVDCSAFDTVQNWSV